MGLPSSLHAPKADTDMHKLCNDFTEMNKKQVIVEVWKEELFTFLKMQFLHKYIFILVNIFFFRKKEL